VQRITKMSSCYTTKL